MNRFAGWTMFALAAAASAQTPMRVALLDFEVQAGMPADSPLAGAVAPGTLAGRGAFLLGRRLLDEPGTTLIDRREFLDQLVRSGGAEGARPSFLRAAQALNADLAVRGHLQSLSAGGQTVRQGGHEAERVTVSLRVGIEALDTRDGAVVALSSGTAQAAFRQTPGLTTAFGEEEVLELLDQAIAAALPDLRARLARRAEAERERETVRLTIVTTADPALVEIDGLLVGVTPIEGLVVYRGDRILTVGRAGYRDVTKRISLDRDTRIEVPMLRTELSAEELRDLLEKIRLHVVIGEPGLTILPLEP